MGTDRPGVRWPADLTVVAAVSAVTTMDTWWSPPGTREADVTSYLLVVVSAGVLLVRRRWPVAVAVVCGSALTGTHLLGHRGELLHLPSIVALYTIAARGDRRRTALIGVIAVTWSAGLAWLTGDRSSAPVAEMLWPVASMLLGEVVRGRRELAREYAARTARAAADREREAARRLARDRIRIAREFHDVVAHTMTAVNVQMGVAVAAFDQRPETARTALAQARTASREALRELRATVALLRDVAPGGSMDPAPRLDQLDDLVARAGDSGLRVSLHRHTGERHLPAVVEVTVYRIVQEALTNVIRHAGAGSAAVAVTRDADTVVVEVVDDGTTTGNRPAPHLDGDPSGQRSRGHGLIGMTERVTAIGGRVGYGPVPGGGFRVHAVLPAQGGAP